VANPEWLEIFDNWDGPKIQKHITELEEQISVFTSQGVGQKNYVKDLAELRGQLSAAYRVLKNRRQPLGSNPGFGISDFSNV